MTVQPRLRILPLAAALLAVAAAACGPAATPSPSPSPVAIATVAPSPTASATPVAPATPPRTPAPTARPTPDPTPSTTPAPTASSPTPRTTPRPTVAPTPSGPTADEFWSRAERGVRDAGRLVVVIDGPAAGSLRFEPTASATVIDDVVGFVCVGGRAYDGQSAFTPLPGRWTCGAAALVAGFRGIGQPIDAWNRTIPTDTRRAESVVVEDGRWTWRYRATSPYYGGAVSATVTLDPATRRVLTASRRDPTGSTRYTLEYGADFPRIAVPD